MTLKVRAFMRKVLRPREELDVPPGLFDDPKPEPTPAELLATLDPETADLLLRIQARLDQDAIDALALRLDEEHTAGYLDALARQRQATPRTGRRPALTVIAGGAR